jgi:hypothetical protein
MKHTALQQSIQRKNDLKRKIEETQSISKHNSAEFWKCEAMIQCLSLQIAEDEKLLPMERDQLIEAAEFVPVSTTIDELKKSSKQYYELKYGTDGR